MTRYMIKRALCNGGMWLVCLISILIIYYEWIIVERIPANGLSTLMNVYALSVYVIFTGMFPGIPYGFSFLEERNSGFLKYILQRMSAKAYIRKKVLATGISGAVATVIPYLAFVIPLALLSGRTMPENGGSLEDVVWWVLAQEKGVLFVYVLRGVLVMLFGILWAELTLLLTMYVRNKYIAFVLPFVVFQIFWLLFPWTDWNPVHMIRSDFMAGETPLLQPFLIFLLYIVLVVIGIFLSFHRQRKCERL